MSFGNFPYNKRPVDYGAVPNKVYRRAHSSNNGGKEAHESLKTKVRIKFPEMSSMEIEILTNTEALALLKSREKD